MAYTVVAASPRTIGVGVEADPSISLRGELLQAWPWHLQLVHEGKVFTCGAGTITTPITIANTAIDVTIPEFLLRVPSGKTVIPLYMHAIYEATGAVLPEGVALISDTDPGNGTSSAADNLPVNLRARGGSSSCTARQLVTVTPTFVGAREFWRFGEPADLDGTVTGESGFTWDYQRDGFVPVVVGPGTLHICMAAPTSGTGYIEVTYAEFNTTSLFG